jgi:hypothetical protein
VHAFEKVSLIRIFDARPHSLSLTTDRTGRGACILYRPKEPSFYEGELSLSSQQVEASVVSSKITLVSDLVVCKRHAFYKKVGVGQGS